MRFSTLAALVLPFVAVANAIDIVGPNENDYWVQNATNTITWTFSEGDPALININVVNANNATLNGAFSIATAVNISVETVTVTNVTLRPGDSYQVQFVNVTNTTQVFASSANFTVKPPGTAAAPTVSLSSSASAASSTAPSSSSSGSSAAATGGTKNGALSLTNGQGVFGVLAACGFASLSAMLL